MSVVRVVSGTKVPLKPSSSIASTNLSLWSLYLRDYPLPVEHRGKRPYSVDSEDRLSQSKSR